MEKHPLHLKNPELQISAEVQSAVDRKEQREGENVPNSPTERIEAYMDRMKHIFLHPKKERRERNIELFKDKIYNALLIKRENFPDSYFELQKRVARERGEAIDEIPENVQEQMKDVAIEDQRASLDAWIEYLTSDDAVYPAWFKYFVWRNITKLSQFDKERGEFKKRTDSTVAPFPDIYREPLAQIADIYEKVNQDNKNLKDPEIKEAFSQKFPALYAELIQKSLAASIENREEIEGEWVKYEKGRLGDAERLFKSLENKGTGWCTAGKSTAQTQVESGDFYVYYTYDSSKNPTQPRIAIRMQDKQIAEIRGILPNQAMEPVVQGALDEKLKDFGKEADIYRKKSVDMRQLTALERKKEQEQEFTKDDLIFLYEVNARIEGFGYKEDPRIAELRTGRDTQSDMLIIFECARNQIANVPSEINENTKAYVGQLEPGIFQKLPANFEHIYTSFPEGKVRIEALLIGGRSARQLEESLRGANYKISDYAMDMLKSKDFETLKNPEAVDLVRLTVKDLGFEQGATTDQIYARADELGLELCPAEVGPQYRLAYSDQPLGELTYIAMKQITDRDGDPNVFDVVHDAGGLWLRSGWARPGRAWDPGDSFVFRLRQVSET